MTVAVHQPQYMPWLGYFDKIDCVDRFVFLETVQYKKNEYQNRNRIKTAQGWQWLTVPVRYRFPQTIVEVPINNQVNWRHKHRQALVSNYTKALFFETYRGFFDALFDRDWALLVDLNLEVVRGLMDLLGIDTPVETVSGWPLSDDPTGRLIDICRRLGADTYLAGAGGQNYMDLPQFQAAGIDIIFQEYRHPEYAQQFGSFEPYMSVLDLLLNCGQDSLDILRSGRHA